MRIGSLSDIHLTKRPFQAFYTVPVDKEILREILVRNNRDEKYFTYPKHCTGKDSIETMKENLIREIKRSELDLLVVNGDTFDLSDGGGQSFPDRDNDYSDELIDFTKGLVKNLEVPTLFLPGNADTNNYRNINPCLSIIRDLSERGIESLNGNLNFTEHGNFSLRTNDCLIIGLNSLSTNNMESPLSSINLAFIKENLKDNDKPVLIFVHHPLFDVIPTEITDILGMRYMKKQEWLDTLLKDYNQISGLPIILITGHCHTHYESHIDTYKRYCAAPSFFNINKTNVNLGFISDISKKNTSIRKFSLSSI